MKFEKNNKIVKKNVKKQKKTEKSKNIILNKIENYENMIQNTIIYTHNYKSMDIINSNELHICLNNCEKIFSELTKIKYELDHNEEIEVILNKLQRINNDVSNLFRLFGTKNIKDVLEICLGSNYLDTLQDNIDIYKTIEKLIHPINYKVLKWKNEKNENKKVLSKNRIVEDFMIVDRSESLDCFDLARTSSNFLTKVYGIKISFQDSKEKQTLIICGIMDETLMKCINSKFITHKLKHLNDTKPLSQEFGGEDFLRFCDSLTIKELLIYSNEELHQKYIGYISQIKLIKQKTISQLVKEFVSSDLYHQRKTLILLLMKHTEPEFQYLAYLLYDLLTSESNGTVDTYEQTLLYDSLPWVIKKFFRNAMKVTVKYTNNLTNFDTNKIPIEQQICLLKAPDSVKEKAMLKLKEVKAKSEDSGSKARSYLEGLIKIPFGIFVQEPVLKYIDQINILFNKIASKINIENIPKKQSYSIIEIDNYIKYITNTYINNNIINNKNIIFKELKSQQKNILLSCVYFINELKKKYKLKKKINHSGKKKDIILMSLKNFLFNCNHGDLCNDLFKKYSNICNILDIKDINKNILQINDYKNKLNLNLTNIRNTLNKSVHGHDDAKRQVERIIGQWISGEQQGYCFGFEGPPGVGKTSLARKGLADCLKDDNGVSRPFSFIALGGSSNGSTLAGHSYTYVGSTWGRIVDIIIEKKCMNPIIFIDELDKVSKTEQGKEIIGILTHLVDATQNESFEDKYFSGVEINLSKALFIFSYNDPSLIDKILLDRIHRIKFNHLTLLEKIEIIKNYILPEINEKLSLSDIIKMDEDIMKYIIEQYTYEPGVRKLKQIMFEIYSEINLNILNGIITELPIVLTKEEIKNKYLKNRHEIIYKNIHTDPKIGIMNGLWANALGMGGIIPIECTFFPSSTFLELKLTGMQGDVMKESMNVAKTLAWKLLTKTKQKSLLKKFKDTKLQGIHIHCPEGATPKDGPSAGSAITTAIYSLLMDKKINNTYAMTGEITLQGDVTAIGGLELKISGGIRSGVKTFLYPEKNEKDYQKFIKKETNKEMIENIQFRSVKHISEILDFVFI
jgi:ATP-dependent Lon protease